MILINSCQNLKTMSTLKQSTREEPMPKTVSASEAKNRLGSMIMWADQSKDEVIIKVYGEPKAVIMSYDEYQNMIKLRDTQRRQALLARLEKLRDEVQEQNQGVTEQEAEETASRFRDDLLGSVVQQRKKRVKTG